MHLPQEHPKLTANFPPVRWQTRLSAAKPTTKLNLKFPLSFIIRILRFKAFFFLLFLWSFFLFPAYADPLENEKKIGVDWVSIEEFVSNFQLFGGQLVVFPEASYKGAFRIGVPRMRLEGRYFKGKSEIVSGFQGSVGDFESRVDYRLDDPGVEIPGDSPGHNVYGFLSWKIWTSTDTLNGVTSHERDEGLGIGISRFPSRKGVSYWYGFSIYPSVHTSLSSQKNAITAEAGVAYNFSDSLALKAGYRAQGLQTGRLSTERANEQGFIFGLLGTF